MGFFPIVIVLDMKKTRTTWLMRIRVLFVI